MNVNHKIHNPTKVSSYGPFPIIWLFWYAYFFLALSILTFPLSVCITTIFASTSVLDHLVSHVFFDNKMIVLDSLLINSATLTIYVQSFICLLEFLSKYVCFVVRDQVVSTVPFIRHEIITQGKRSLTFFDLFLFAGFHYLYSINFLMTIFKKSNFLWLVIFTRILVKLM